MEFSMVSLVLLLVLFTVLKHLLGNKFGYKLPPSPRALPVVGHVHHMRHGLPHKIFQRFSQRYGPIFHMRFGVRSTVVVSNSTLAREVLKTQDSVFASRPYFIVGEFCYGFRDIAFVPNNEHWKNMRKICAVELFTARRLNSFVPVRFEEVRRMIKGLSHSDSLLINVREVARVMSFNIITRILVSRRFLKNDIEEDDEDAREFMELLGEISSHLLQFHVSELIPSWLRWIDWTRPGIKRLGMKVDKFMQKIVDQHKANGKRPEGIVADFVDILLEQCDEEIVKTIIMELIQAGSHSSTAVTEWTMAELLQNPDVLKKSQEELESKVGNSRLVEESDLENLDYLQAILKEVFRLHPPGPLLGSHMTTEDCKLAGYDIPKGTVAMVNVYVIGRDPQLWEDPNVFNPDRFLGNSIDVKGQDFELLPFGAGRRACPGMMLGLQTVLLMIANLIHGFEWSYPAGESFAMEESGGIVTWLKKPLHAVISPRLPAQTYL